MGLYDTTMGPLILGIFLNTFLYGLVTYQFAAYHRRKFNDRSAVKCMVLFLFILDTFHSTSVVYMAWYYTVTNYDKPTALAAIWPHTLTPLCTSLAALVTQMYLGFRIFRFTGSKILYGVVILLAPISFIMGTICSIQASVIKIMSELTRVAPTATAWLSTQVVVDEFITITLVVVFSSSRTGYRKTDTALNRLLRGAIQTGLFVGIFSIADLVTFLVIPRMGLYGMFGFPLGRIYTNTLMDTLLTRESLKEDMTDTFSANGTSGPMEWAPTVTPGVTSTVQMGTTQMQKTV